MIPSGPTDKDLDAARRPTVVMDLLGRFMHNAGVAPQAPRLDGEPRDIVEEERLHQRLRAQPGVFKRRNSAPNLLVSAARTPGEVARTLLTIACYLALMFLIIGLGGERVQAVPGVFQVFAMGVLVIPAMLLSSFLWRSLGEGPRDVVRMAVRFWPLTLVGLIFLLGVLRVLLG